MNETVSTICTTSQSCTEVFEIDNLPDLDDVNFQVRQTHVKTPKFKPLLANLRSKNMHIRKRLYDQLAEASKKPEVMDREHRNGLQARYNRNEMRKIRKVDSGISYKRTRTIESVFEEWIKGEHRVSVIARKAGCSFRTAKTIIRDSCIWGTFPTMKHRIEKEAKRQAIDICLGEDEFSYSGLKHIKRRCQLKGLKMSTAFISKRLKERGLFYGKIPKTKPNDHRQLNEEQLQKLRRVLNTLSIESPEEKASVYYVDEMKLPIQQVPERFWRNKRDLPGVARMGREVITCVCFASPFGFCFVQYFLKELKSEDFLFFLAECLRRLQCSEGGVAIILDNASWHTGGAMKNCLLRDYLVFNLPGFYSLNVIENMFSGVRSLFRSRMICRTLQEEVTIVNQIFRSVTESAACGGFFRNGRRAAIEAYDRYF